MIPDYETANLIIEKEYKELIKEQYILFRHLNISLIDQDKLTSEDRRALIQEFIDERQAQIDAANKSSSYNVPTFGGLEQQQQ